MSNLQSRIYLEAAKFFYEQMELDFQDSTKFLYFLLAFLAIARSVTLVFQKEFKHTKPFMEWYDSRVRKWNNDKVMEFFKEMRDLAVHVHIPKMLVRALAPISLILNVKKASAEGTEIPTYEPATQREKNVQTTPIKPEIISYIFHVPKGFDENPDVMYLCKRYLGELEKFVTEAENMIKKRRNSN